ncbi:MAG: HAMP domain-containing histidine kinase [Fibrobacteria bacterium]|nr:HAMP domain-containing histidine kinase [Fibrobacteria bacterium]
MITHSGYFSINKFINVYLNKNNNQEVFRRVKLFLILWIAAVSANLGFGIFSYAKGEFLLASSNVLSVCLLSVNLLLLFKTRQPGPAFHLFQTLAGCLFLFLMIMGGNENLDFIWSYSFPIVAFFLLGKKYGITYSLGYLLLGLLILFFPGDVLLYTTYTVSFKVWFVVSFIIISVFCLYYEVTREEAFQLSQQHHKKMLETAHKAGQADIATSVLHNIGNILNSVATSSHLIQEITENSKTSSFKKATKMLRENMDNIDSFILNNPKGKELLKYFLVLEDILSEENQALHNHSERLHESIEAIKTVVTAQQSIATFSPVQERGSLHEVIDNALYIQSNQLESCNITITKEYANTPEIIMDKNQVIHIVINLLRNAQDAMVPNSPEHRTLLIQCYAKNNSVFASFTDNGSGIKEKDLKNIFNQGFTTKKDGHGFGLHSCANYMNEMGGTISLKTGAKNIGATIILQFPIT